MIWSLKKKISKRRVYVGDRESTESAKCENAASDGCTEGLLEHYNSVGDVRKETEGRQRGQAVNKIRVRYRLSNHGRGALQG